MLRVIAGPCSIEGEDMALRIARKVKKVCDDLGIEYYFKGSFDKANRTSIHSNRGLGIEEGLRILKKVKDEVGVPVVTDIHEPWQAKIAADVVDVIQIPAFLCRQTDLLIAAAQTGKMINIKKAQFLAPWDMNNVATKVRESGNNNIMLCERGTTFGYGQLVVDMTAIVEMKKLGYPVIFDATHSVQKPGSLGDSTGGNREYVEYLAKAAVAAGADGVFIETHENPDEAISDGPNMIPTDHIKDLLSKIKAVYDIINGD